MPPALFVTRAKPWRIASVTYCFPDSTASWRGLPNAGAPGPSVHPTHQTRAQGIGRTIPAASPRPDRASSALLLFSVVGAASHAARPLCSPGPFALPTLSPSVILDACPRPDRGSSQVKDPASLPLPFPFVPPPSHAAPSWRLKAQLRPGPEPPHPTLVVRGRNPANAPPLPPSLHLTQQHRNPQALAGGFSFQQEAFPLRCIAAVAHMLRKRLRREARPEKHRVLPIPSA